MSRIVGISGEGVTRPDGSHAYVYLAAVREDGKLIADAWDKNGLQFKQCVSVLLTIPKGYLTFCYGSSYDATKIFEGIERRGKYNEGLDKFFIFHPEVRRIFWCGKCGAKWKSRKSVCPKCGSGLIKSCSPLHRFRGRGYTADVHGFTVAEGRTIRKRAVAWKKTVRVWDAFGFTHRPFDESLEMLDIGTRGDRKYHGTSKLQEKGLYPECLRHFCKEKAHKIALMMRKILDNVGVDLKGQYRGAGSIAGALLRNHNIAKYRGRSQGEIAETNPELANAIMCAYHSGRTEISRVGLVEGPLYEYDISGAYPWAMTKLPCLKCGHWRKATEGLWEMRSSGVGLVRFKVDKFLFPQAAKDSWAPLPCRMPDGSIVWGMNCEGWAWWPEFEAAMYFWPHHVRMIEGWAFHTRCRHKPFEFIHGEFDKRRSERDAGMLGVRKQAQSALYGKLAQRIYSPVQSYVWAGMTTARIHARVIDELARNIDAVSVATDSIIVRRKFRDVGPTAHLGGWRFVGEFDRAYFAAPGLYFDAPPPGLRKGKIVTYEREFMNGRRSVMAMIRCKCGASWDFAQGFTCPFCGGLGGAPRATYVTHNGSRVYGWWVKQRQEISTLPGPKRADEVGPQGQLYVRDLGGVVSLPYDPHHRTV